jgi:hypothetical protein
MAKFDVEGARRAGYSDAEIADFLAGEDAFDTAAARQAGYTDAEIIGHLSGPSTPVKKPRTGLDKATQVAGITTGVLAPYATAAGLGALATGVPTGGLGAPIGAAGGVLALGAVDLGTALYNLGGSFFGADSIPLPSQTIRKGYESVGIGRSPETKGEQVYNDVLDAGTSAFSQGKAAQNLFKTGSQPVQNFMRDMGQNVRGQTVAGAAAGGAPSVASNYFDVTNPNALSALSLAAGVTGNKVARPNPKPVSAASLKDEATNLYKQMEAEGVQIAPQAMTDLEAAIGPTLSNMRYNPVTDKLVNQVVKMFRLQSGKPMSFDMLEEFRKSVRDTPYTQSGAGRGTPKERAIIAALDDTIDNYMDNLTPAQVTSGDPAAATAFLKKARDVRARGYRTETLEGAFKKATDASKRQEGAKPFASGLRYEFRKIAEDPRKLSKFDKPTQDLIKKTANGTITQKGLQALGAFSPSAALFGADLRSVSAVAKNALYGTGAYASPIPTAIAAGTTTAAKGIANQMTKGQAKRALVSAAQPGGGIKPGGPGYFALAPIAQQNVLAQDRAKKRKMRDSDYTLVEF